MGPMLCNRTTRQSKCSGSGAPRIVDVATEVHAMVDGKAGSVRGEGSVGGSS